MSAALHLSVRLAHVLGMAILLGGAAFAWQAFRTDPRSSLSVAIRFEWVFWATMGVMVATGVGNLGALGAPGPTTRWGTVLTAKLLLVLGFGLGSVVRSLAVHRLCAATRGSSVDDGSTADGSTADESPVDDGPSVELDARSLGVVRRSYAATAWALVLLVALAEVLAHG